MSHPKDESSPDPIRFQRVSRLFERAVDLSPDERNRFLDRECADDPDLRSEVDALLAADVPGDALAGAPTPNDHAEFLGAGAARDRLEPNDRVGPYEIQDLIAVGGMGRIYRARRVDQQYERLVAIKIIKRGMDTEEVVRRFQAERQTLAHLDHALIARLYDGGVTEAGLPYLVMEYIEGLPIDVYCDSHSLSIDARIDLFRQVCSAVDFAHRNLVVHRDLKPGNILVDTEGNPKLLDFGIAKVLSPSDPEDPTLTQGPAAPMTPAYASPEQVLGHPVTTACDVYAMGVILYELLTGRRPYQVQSRSPLELQRIICEEDPEAPSTAIKSRTDADPESCPVRDMSPHRLGRKLRGDLDNIVLMALRKEPRRRYASVRDLAADLQRYRNGHPVLARQDLLSYRLGKFVLRHRTLSVMAGVLALTVIGGIIAFAWKAHVASIEGEKFKRIAGFVQNMLASVRPEHSGVDVTVREILDEASHWMERDFRDQPEVEASLRTTLGLSYQSLGIFDRSRTHLARALHLHETSAAGGTRQDLTRARTQLGSVLLDLGDYESAHGLFLQAEAEVDADSADALSVLLGRSEVHVKRGELDEGEQCARGAHRLASQHHGPESLSAAKTLAHLASVQFAQGVYEEADRNFARALAIEEREFGRDDPRIATELNNWGVLKYRVHNAGEARPYLERAVEIRRSKLAEDHPALAESLTALGSALISLGERHEAERCFTEAIRINRESLRDDHPALASSLNYLVVIKTSARKFEEAEALHEEALAILREKFGPDHIRIASTLEHLGRLYRRQGLEQKPRAIETYLAALDMKRRVLGPDHPDLEASLVALGGIHSGAKRPDMAQPYLEEVLRLRRHSLPEGHVQIGHALHQLAQNECKLGRHERELALLEESTAIYAASGDETISLHQALTELTLGECLVHNGRFPQAEARIGSAHARLVELLGAGHRNVQVRLRRLIKTYQEADRPEDVARYQTLLEASAALGE